MGHLGLEQISSADLQIGAGGQNQVQSQLWEPVAQAGVWTLAENQGSEPVLRTSAENHGLEPWLVTLVYVVLFLSRIFTLSHFNILKHFSQFFNI